MGGLFGGTSSMGYRYSSAFEELKVLGYLRNVINSPRLTQHRERIVVSFAGDCMGRDAVADIVRSHFPEKAEQPQLQLWQSQNENDHGLDRRTSLAVLKEMLSRIDQRLRKLEKTGRCDLSERLLALEKTFSFSRAEMEIIIFYLLWKTTSILTEYFNGAYNSIADFSEILKFRSSGNLVLGVPRAAFLKVFEKGLVFHTGIIEKNRGVCVELSDWATDYICGFGKKDLESEFYTFENDEALQVSDFDLSREELLVVDSMMRGRTGRNLLFYGTPGTGKTSFARSLAKQYGKKLYSVKVPECDNQKDRLRAVIAAVNLADAGNSLVLVDEADEILNTGIRLHDDTVSKAWINNFLDTHAKKVIWVTNRSRHIDASTMRRFSFSIEYKQFDPKKRLKVLKHALSAKNIPEEYFTEEELGHLCRTYSVNAAGIVNAISSVKITTRTNKSEALSRIRTILKNHEKAIGGKTAAERTRTFEHYSLDGLNPSMRLDGIIEAAKKHACAGAEDTAPTVPSVSLLLYGMPGTGKSEFVNYLGHVLDREVLLKRSSDIQSKWVGETEQNIAAAFREARERGVMLFFDEADTFLFPRASAMQSWEKSFTNEILTQLENHRGVVVFATNDIDGLDHAALRRFTFKVRFDPLTPEGNQRFYDALLKPLLPEARCLTESETGRLCQIPNLTPGDFAVVRNQVLLTGTEGLSHEGLISSLENEVKYKKNSGKAVGF